MNVRRGIGRGLRTFEVAALLLAAGLIPFSPAHAEDATTTLGFYALAGAAAPIFETFNQPSAGIPATPTEEFSISHSEAALDNGSAHALASILWPGSTAANLPSALHDLGVPPQVPTPPNYPVRAETFFPTSPGQKTSDSLNAGVVSMDSDSSALRSFAAAHSADVAGLIVTGVASSSTKDTVSGGTAVTEARSSVSDVEILGGIVSIQKVATLARATSDGVKGKVEGGTVVSGLTVQGVGYTVDGDGVHANGNGIGPPPSDLTEQLNAQLKAIGIQIFVAEPLDILSGPTASRTVGGLIITFQPKTLADHLPPGIFQQIFQQLPPDAPQVPPALYTFDQTFTIALGGAIARASAGEPVPPPPPPTTPPPSVTGDTFTIPPPPPPVVTSPPPSPAPVPSTTPAAASGPPAGRTLPVALAAVGLIGAAGTSRVLRRVADGMLADGPVGAACNLEDV